MKATEIIKALDLQPHPEGGWYRQTWEAEATPGERPAGTAIYYLLEKGRRSHWHRVDAVEIWHFHAGDPLLLKLAATDQSPVETHALGPDLALNQSPQIIVPQHHWQAAESTGAWTLVSCTVSPGFRFEGFEMAPKGWKPKG